MFGPPIEGTVGGFSRLRCPAVCRDFQSIDEEGQCGSVPRRRDVVPLSSGQRPQLLAGQSAIEFIVHACILPKQVDFRWGETERDVVFWVAILAGVEQIEPVFVFQQHIGGNGEGVRNALSNAAS